MRRHTASDRGATLVVVALVVTAIFIAVALVIDVGQLRTDRQTNKRLADSAAAAAAQDLQTGPWRAVCTAYQYALANADGFSSFTSETWSSGDDGATFTTGAPGCPSGVSYTAPCTDDAATWARFHGEARDGDITVDILSGYVLPDARFGEDASITGDDGQPCDQVAVIVSERRTPLFGQVAGVHSQSTTIRSVARITRGPSQVAALVVLDRTICNAIDASTNGGRLVVHASGDTPGSINVDSDGSGCSGGQKVVDASALPGGGPNTIAEQTAGAPSKTGRIGIVALSTNPSAAYTQACPYSASPPATCTMTPVPTRSPRLGRTFLDERYLDPVRQAVGTAASTVSSMPSSYTRLTTVPGVTVTGGSNPTCSINGIVNVTSPTVYADCNVTVQSGATLEFSGTDATIVFGGTINVAGTSGQQGPGALVTDAARALYVAGTNQGSAVAINVSGNFRINDGNGGSCAAPSPGNRTTTMVVQAGALDVGGGSTSVLRMCQTAVVMASGYSATGGPSTAWPTTPGAAPYDNSFNGEVTIGGQGTVEWTAPNAVPNAPATASDWQKLEDLTLWTETSVDSSIGGQGTVRLAGVFALPNCFGTNGNGFTLGGTGSQQINANAQFWTRKLRLAGQAILEMAPNPNDSIPVLDFALVR